MLRHNAGPFTWAILLICIAVFILQNLLGDQPVMIWLAWPYDPSLQFEAWRYFSHAFMHFSLMHILFNLLWWWYLGGAVEKRIGSGKLVVITVISALLSGFVQHQFSGRWLVGRGLRADGLRLAAGRARSAERYLSAARVDTLLFSVVNCWLV